MSDWLDGPRLVLWLESHGLEHPEYQLQGLARRVREWAKGAPANVFTADKVLIRIGRHLSEVPEDLYLPGRLSRPPLQGRRTNPTYDAETKRRAIEAVRAGRSRREVAKEVGCNHDTVGRWAA